jgi:hypothetical protein
MCLFVGTLGGEGGGLVIGFLTNGTENESQNRTVIHGTEKVSQYCTLVFR